MLLLSELVNLLHCTYYSFTLHASIVLDHVYNRIKARYMWSEVMAEISEHLSLDIDIRQHLSLVLCNVE